MADIFADPMTLRGLVAVGAYLLGAVPFGLLLTKAAGLGDVRRIGSGNIGATNVLRTGRKGLAAATLLLDVLKGAAAVLIAKWLNPADDMLPVAAGLAAFLGHLYPVWLQFKGGKGVATAAGVLLAWSWPMALMLIAVWMISLLVSRISSFAGLSAAAVAPLLIWAAGRPDLVAPTIVLSLLIIWRHKANIARLLKGEEPKIGGDKKG